MVWRDDVPEDYCEAVDIRGGSAVGPAGQAPFTCLTCVELLWPSGRIATGPVVVHLPHASTMIPAKVRADIELDDDALAQELDRVTAHLTDALVAGALQQAGEHARRAATVVTAPLSRLVVDVAWNPGAGGAPADVTDAVPLRTHDGELLRKAADPALVARYHSPHATEIAEVVGDMLAVHGRALILDIHALPSSGPSDRTEPRDELDTQSRLSTFTHRSLRPQICFGVDEHHTPIELVEHAQWAFDRFLTSINDPSVGTYVPFASREVDRRVWSIRIAIRKDEYMDERTGKLHGEAQRVMAAIARLIGVQFVHDEETSDRPPGESDSSTVHEVLRSDDRYGFELLADGDVELAAAWFTVMAGHREDPDYLHEVACRFYETDELETASRWAEMAAFEHAHPPSILLLGRIAVKLGDLRWAESLFREVADADGDTDAMYELAVVLRSGGEDDEALALLERLLAVTAMHPEAMHLAARLLQERGRADEAREWWWTAARHHGHLGAMAAYGKVLYAEHDLQGAEEWWTKAASRSNTESMILLGELFLDPLAYDPPRAEGWLKRAAVERRSVEAMTRLGDLHRRRRDWDESRYWYREGAHREDPVAMTSLGLLLVQIGAPHEGERWLTKAADHHDHVEAMYELGLHLYRLKDHGGAHTWWSRASFDHEHVDSMHMRGVLCRTQGDDAAARVWWTRAAERGHAGAKQQLVTLPERLEHADDLRRWNE